MTGYHNWRTLPDYHLDFDKLCTTFKKRAQFSIKFLLHLCLLKWSFRCLFFIRGSVISFLLLKNHSLTNFLNCFSSSQIFGTFCTESTTAVSMTSFMWIQDLQASIFSELQGFLQVLQHPLSFYPSIYRFMGMIQRYGRKACLCLVNYKRTAAKFCMCAHLDACMEARTCLVDVQWAIWRSWYDPAQRTMVKSALVDLDIHEKSWLLWKMISS